MTLPVGVLALFYSVCPAGWAPLETTFLQACAQGCTVVSESTVRSAPQPALWCMKQSEPQP